MKILFVWHAAVEKNYRKLLAAMAEDNEIILATAHRWFESSKDQFFKYNPQTDSNIKIFKFFTVFYNHIRSFFYPNIFKMIYILLKKPEALYLKEEPFSLNAFQWVLLTKIFSKKTRIIVESDENLKINHPFPFRLMEKFVLNNIDSIACVATKGIELYKSKGFSKKIYKTFYFYNEEIFKPLDRNLCFEKLGFKLDGTIFGYAGRITEEKGIQDIVLAMVRLCEKYKDVYLIIAGKGEKEYEENLKKVISEKRLEKNIKFLGSLSYEKLVYFYNVLDALILPSHSTEWWVEQFGRVIIEAMACGTPVIGSSSGEIPFVINNHKLVYMEKNVEELSSIMRKFITGELSKKKLSQMVISEAGKYTLKMSKSNKIDIIKETLKC